MKTTQQIYDELLMEGVDPYEATEAAMTLTAEEYEEEDDEEEN